MSDPRVCIIVPCYNEEKNIEPTLREIREHYPQGKIVVIDDGSLDRTFEAAKQLKVQVVRLPFNLGIGGAVQTGYQVAAKEGFDIAVQMDGDGQHPAESLNALIQPVLNQEVDMSIGSRFLNKQGFQSTFLRRIGIRFLSTLLNLLTGLKLTDPTSGFRAVNRKIIQQFADYYPVDYPEPESILIAHQSGFRIGEIGVQMKERWQGRSSIDALHSIYYMVKVTFAILLRKMKKGS